MSASYVLPFCQTLSTGIVLNYHLGRLQHEDLGNIGSLSVISMEATTEWRSTLQGVFYVFLSCGAGYYYTFQNDKSANYASNLVWNGRVGIGFRVKPTLAIGLQGEYRRYCRLYHMIGTGLAIDFRLGGMK